MGKLILGLIIGLSVFAHADMSAISEMSPSVVDSYYDSYIKQGMVSDADYGQLIGTIQSNRKRDDAAKTKAMQQECKATKRWKLILVQHDLVIARDKIQSAKNVLETDKKAARISGYENGAIRNLAAWSMVDNQDKVKRLFAQYRTLGGTAPNAYKVSRLSNKDYFCENINVQTKQGLPTQDEFNTLFAAMRVKRDLELVQKDEDENRVEGQLPVERTHAEIKNKMAELSGSLLSSYRRLLDEYPTRKGAITIKLRVFASGKVVDAVVVSSDLNNHNFESRLLSRVKALQFQQGNFKIWENTYQFNFSPNAL
jgi:hypothetical protein